MALAQVISHRPRFGVADAVHGKMHRAVDAANVEPPAAVEHTSRLRRAERRQ